jgi:MFS family permease
VLIGARVVQGISAAIMVPTALSLLMTTFEEGTERNKALGVWTAMAASGATAALLIGGPITDGLGWEWIFLINIPIAILILVLSPVLLHESRDRERPRAFDLGGALTITTALVLLVYAVVEAPDAGWTDARTIGVLAGSAILMALFAVIEARSAAPLVPLRIFRLRALVGGNLLMLVLGMIVFGMGFTLTLYAQQVLGYSAIEFGLGTVVYAVMAIVGSAIGQAIVTRTGFRPVAVTGMTLVAAGCLLLTQVSADGSYFGDIFLGLLVFGPGLGACFVAAAIAALTGIAERESGLASGINSATFQIGGALGVAATSTIAVSYAVGSEPLVALTEGFRAAFVACVIIAVVGLVVAIALPRQGRQSPVRGPETAPAPGQR